MFSQTRGTKYVDKNGEIPQKEITPPTFDGVTADKSFPKWLENEIVTLLFMYDEYNCIGSFIVKSDGTLDDILIEKPYQKEIKKEIINKIMSSQSKWKPARDASGAAIEYTFEFSLK